MLAEQTINELRKRFNRQAAGDICATYLFTVSGEGGGSWLTKIAKGNCDFIHQSEMSGAEAAPDCEIFVEASDLELIMSGRLSAMTAALSGVLAIEGELGLAMQLVPIFFGAEAGNITDKDAIAQTV